MIFSNTKFNTMTIEAQPHNIQQWIFNIIASCSEDFHFSAVDSLIELFKVKYGEVTEYDELLLQREIKWNQIKGIIPPKYENG